VSPAGWSTDRERPRRFDGRRIAVEVYRELFKPLMRTVCEIVAVRDATRDAPHRFSTSASADDETVSATARR
jgi:hypothetical protein